MRVFWFFWIFDAVMAVIPIIYFFIGLMDRSITIRNIAIWLLILLIVAAVLIGSMWLKAANHLNIANIILVAASIPGWILLLYMLIILIGKPRWN